LITTPLDLVEVPCEYPSRLALLVEEGEVLHRRGHSVVSLDPAADLVVVGRRLGLALAHRVAFADRCWPVHAEITRIG
jgi:hypothetical protein